MKSCLDFRKLIKARLVLATPLEQNTGSWLAESKEQLLDFIYLVKMRPGKENDIIRQIHQLQNEITLLSNEIFKRHNESPNEFCELAQQTVIEILESLQCCKDGYFNNNQAIPLYVAKELAIEFKEKTLVLQAAMKKAKISIELQQIVLKPLLCFDKKEHNSFTEIKYIQNYIDTIISNVKNMEEEDLFKTLVHLGFNSLDFTQYYKQRIIEKVNTSFSMIHKLEILYDYELIFRCHPKKSTICYDPYSENSRTSLLRFIEAEINCLVKKQQLSTPKTEVTRPSDYRIKTSLTVDGLAYLLRLLVEAEVFDANPRSQLIAFMAANVQTRGKGEGTISSESLSTKYRQVNQTTAIGIKSLLLNMVKQVQISFNL